MTFNSTWTTPLSAKTKPTHAKEVHRILETVSEQVQAGRQEATILDNNGNRVGAWRITGR